MLKFLKTPKNNFKKPDIWNRHFPPGTVCKLGFINAFDLF